ncbi:MAG: metallophosphoesterase [Bacillota bacterium]|nr:metallophosphoesterase [Bacillota bacterium]
MKKIRLKYRLLIPVLLLVAGIFIFLIWQNNSIVITRADYCSEKIPSQFDNFVIVHISDLHNKEFGKNQVVLLDKVRNINPDIIVVTGDLIDRRKYDLPAAMNFITGAVEIAPVYFVSGNHEAWSGEYPEIRKRLIDAGVIVADDAESEIVRGESSIKILGVSDPYFLTSGYLEGTNVADMAKVLEQWSGYEGFKILLSHRPELFDLYWENNMDLIFVGHAHGGQIRMPFIGGLFAPDQGFFPEYTCGSYSQGSSTMFISRGLGNSVIPVRIFNRPEVVVVVLHSNQGGL